MKKIYSTIALMGAMLSLSSLESKADTFTKKLDYFTDDYGTDGKTVAKYDFTYDDKGNCATNTLQYNDGVYEYNYIYGYDDNHNCTSFKNYQYDSGAWKFHGYSKYEYDSNGNRTKADSYTEDGSTLIATTTYTYNEYSKILTETSSSGTIEYTYDEHGNLTKTSNGTYTRTCNNTYDAAGHLIKIEKFSNGSCDRIEEFDYDEVGDVNQYSFKNISDGSIYNGTKYVYTKNAEGDISTVTIYGYKNGDWSYRGKEEFIFDTTIPLSSLAGQYVVMGLIYDEFFGVGNDVVQAPKYALAKVTQTSASSSVETFLFSYSDYTPSAISNIGSDFKASAKNNIYSIDGSQQASMKSGLNIIKSAEGKVIKVIK